MKPTSLAVIDFDGSLYRSPTPTSVEEAGTWWYHAYPLASHKAPGFDGRWILPVVMEARRSSLDPTAATILLTGRPQSHEMLKMLKTMAAKADIKFDAFHLQPVLFPGTTPVYKAVMVKQWLDKLPSIKKVTLWDDIPENHAAVRKVVEMSRRKYWGVLTPGLGVAEELGFLG